MIISGTYKNTVMIVAATAIGAAVPLLPLGVAVTQGLLGLGLVLLLAVTPYEPDVRKTFRSLIFNPVTFALAVMFIAWLTVVPWSNGPFESFKVIARTALYMSASALIWAHFCVRPDLQRRSLSVLMVFSAVMLVVACTLLLSPHDAWAAIQALTAKTTMASRQFKALASALVCLLPVLIWIGHSRGGNWRLLSWAMVPAILYVMEATHSRSSIAGVLIMLAVVAAVVVWARGKMPKVAWAALPLTIAAGISWVWIIGQRYPVIKDSFVPTWLIDPHRQVIWRFVFEKFLEAPWTGHGVNRINYVPGADAVRADVGGAVISSHPHNWVLEILSETGVFGFTAVLLVLAFIAWRLLARYKHGHDISALALIALGAAFFGSNLFNFSIWSSWWLLTLFVLFAMVSARRRAEGHAPDRKKILFVVTEDWAFCSHRLPTAKAAHAAGFDVAVTAREGKHRSVIEGLGYRFVPWSIRRKSLNPFYEFLALADLIGICGRERPSVVYNVTLKPIIYGSIAARFADTGHTINLFSGMGTWFISERPSMRLLRAVVMPVLRLLHAEQGTWLMVQNSDDLNVMGGLRIGNPERRVLVPGSGIDTDAFAPLPEPSGPLTAVLLSRMLWDKGIAETVEAARILKAQGSAVRIVLVGDTDTDNPSHVPQALLRQWADEGVVEWWGRRDDIQAVWAAAHVALLPSYREGMPRSLLEGAACGRPMIAADCPGCRDLVKDGINGLLVPVKDAQAIADALILMEADPELRRRLGQAARKDMEDIYGVTAIGARIQDILRNFG